MTSEKERQAVRNLYAGGRPSIVGRVAVAIVVVVVAVVVFAKVTSSPSVAGCPYGQHLEDVGESGMGGDTIWRCVP